MFENLPPRLDLIAPGELAPAQRALYDAITGGPRVSQRGTVPITDADGRLLGPFAVMLLAPAVGDAMQQVGAKIRFGTALTGRERELAILSVAGVLRSDFERLAHEPAARALGLTQPQIDAVLSGRIPDDLPADEALICRLARVMTADRTLSDDDYGVGLAELGQERLAELTWLAGYYAALALALAVFRPRCRRNRGQPRHRRVKPEPLSLTYACFARAGRPLADGASPRLAPLHRLRQRLHRRDGRQQQLGGLGRQPGQAVGQHLAPLRADPVVELRRPGSPQAAPPACRWGRASGGSARARRAP